MEEARTSIKPLSELLRPADLEHFAGQEHLTERIHALYHAKRLPSILLFGPPGCGKSSLALLLAKHHAKNILRLSAPEVGLQQLRKQLQGVDILVLDELHRFSKAQQDFFLPILESGEMTMIATTTENPSFSITKQLLSRLHVLKLRPLSKENLVELAHKAKLEQETDLEEDIIQFLATIAHGDARTMLNLLEYVVSLPKEKQNLANVTASMPEILNRHDKNGDSHYELASAMIKSIRGSDPDAALYYLACLLQGGEDPRFICRRLILSASEDVGLADPQALTLAVSCQQAVEFVGMPEGFIPLSQTVIYLALAPKSNSTYNAYHLVTKEIKTHGVQAVPMHLRNASTKLQREWGYGQGYKYPHNFKNAWVEQDYFPENVENRTFYYPKTEGEEKRLAHNWSKLTKK